MKGIFCLLLFVVTAATAYSQNPLIECVSRTPRHEEEEELFLYYYSDFSAKTTGRDLEYFYKGIFYDPYENAEYRFTHTATIPFKSITEIELYSDAILLVSNEVKIKVDGDDAGIAEEMQDFFIIYMASREDSEAVANWLKGQVSACGGAAVIVD